MPGMSTSWSNCTSVDLPVIGLCMSTGCYISQWDMRWTVLSPWTLQSLWLYKSEEVCIPCSTDSVPCHTTCFGQWNTSGYDRKQNPEVCFHNLPLDPVITIRRVCLREPLGRRMGDVEYCWFWPEAWRNAQLTVSLRESCPSSPTELWARKISNSYCKVLKFVADCYTALLQQLLTNTIIDYVAISHCSGSF